MPSYLPSCIGASSSPCLPPPHASTTALYASNGHTVTFARAPADRLLQRSAMTACLGWEGPRASVGLSAPALRWLSQAQHWAQSQAVLLTPPASLAMELHRFADAYCVPRVARAAQRSLADGLCVETFADTWLLALDQEITTTTFGARCFAWGLREHAALLAAGVFDRLERQHPEAHRAWVAAALQCMSHAEPADWRTHELGFVWALREAQRLNMSYIDVALPEARQVACDDLQHYRRWVLEHPIWAEVPAVTRAWAHDDGKLRRRDDYILHQLEYGVPARTFDSLTTLLRPDTPDVDARLFQLLPIYAKRGDQTAMAWLLARAPGTLSADARREVLYRACEAALWADRADALCYLLGEQTPAQARDLFAQHATDLATLAALGSEQGLLHIIGELQKSGHWGAVDKDTVIEAAITAGRIGAVQRLLEALPASEHATLVFCEAALARAVHRGDAPMAQWLWSGIEDAVALGDILLRHLPSLPQPLPWACPGSREATWRGNLQILSRALPHLQHATDDALVDALVEPWAQEAARLEDVAAMERLLRFRSTPLWRKRCVEKALPRWLQNGASPRGVRVMLDFLHPDDVEQVLNAHTVRLAQKAAEGGDVATLQWLVERAASSATERHALYREAFQGGASALRAAEGGHVAMLRFWLEDYAKGAFGQEATAYANYGIMEVAASANLPDILDMARAHLQAQGALDRVMAQKGENLLAFAIRHNHRDMVRKLLAWPSSDGTRWSILAGDNSPMLWAERIGVHFMRALLTWAPASYRETQHKLGMSGAVISACAGDRASVARFALSQGGDAAKCNMLAAHCGRVVTFAAERGDVIILEQARELSPLAKPTKRPGPNPQPPT